MNRFLTPIVVLLLAIAASGHAGSMPTNTMPSTDEQEDALVLDESEIERVLALSSDVAYGEYLASGCASCHLEKKVGSSNVPVIHGAPAQYLVRVLLEYRSGLRTNSTMSTVAISLGDEEVAVLAHYLASQGPLK